MALWAAFVALFSSNAFTDFVAAVQELFSGWFGTGSV